jgi:hypothetical protein
MESLNRNWLLAISLLTNIFVCLNLFSQNQENTIIHGTVTDASTGAPIPFASVFLKGTITGTTTDYSGNYKVETTVPPDSIGFSFIGYQTEFRKVIKGREQTINVRLSVVSTQIKEVVIKGNRKKYRNKGNPAVELIDNVISHKASNRQESFDFLEYKKYEKFELALNNITKDFIGNNPFHNFKSVFENIDTLKGTDKLVIPLYIQESLSSNYYRKEPEAKKEIVIAEKTVNLDEYLNSKGTSAYLDNLYQNINIYDNEILFMTNKFLSPIAKSAPAFYRFYIIDTLKIDNTDCIRLFFEPRNSSDFLFHGDLFITNDTSYAVRKINLGINKNINIDWIHNISIIQNFEKSNQNTWLLSHEEISMDFGIFKNMLGFYGQRTVSYTDYKINEPIDNKVFRGAEKSEKIDIASNKPDFWEANRLVPLTKPEQRIYTTIDSLRKTSVFRRKMNLIVLLTVGFYDLGKFEIGPVSSFYSYNPVEGSRLRFGGRTTPDFSKKITIDGYMAYGFKDEELKYRAGITWSLTDRTIYQFPVKSVSMSLQKEVQIPGQELQFNQVDNIFLSFKRGINDKLFLNNIFTLEYLNEYENHFSWLAGYRFTKQSTEGNLFFNPVEYGSPLNEVSHINISEPYINLRYAPNESFYQGKLYRTTFANKYPILQLDIAAGPKFLNNDFNYVRTRLNLSKRFYISILGYTDVSLEGGKIFGKVSYPLLFIHNANQTYSYQIYAYNLMNFLEFVSDQYVSINVDHSFNGFFFNKIPLIKKLKLREIVTFKGIYGSLSNKNNPDYQPDLFKFPTDSEGIPLTYTFHGKGYIEAGVGVSNIFNVLRIDLVKRFSYKNYPNVDDYGFRIQFRLDI